MDNTGYCTCEACAAIDAGDPTRGHVDVRERRGRANRKRTDVLISTYAYQTRANRRRRCTRHNVMINCAVSSAATSTQSTIARPRTAFSARHGRLEQESGHHFIWHYNTNFHGYMLPFPNLRAIGKSVRYFERNKGAAFSYEPRQRVSTN